MKSINLAVICGRIGQAPVMRQAGNSSVTTFSVATSRSFKKGDEWQEETQWHNVQCWGQSAERAATYGKGDIVYVTGEIRYRKYTDQNGVEKSITDINANSVQMMEKYKPKDGTAPAPAHSVAKTDAPASTPFDDPDPFAGTNDLPF